MIFYLGYCFCWIVLYFLVLFLHESRATRQIISKSNIEKNKRFLRLNYGSLSKPSFGSIVNNQNTEPFIRLSLIIKCRRVMVCIFLRGVLFWAIVCFGWESYSRVKIFSNYVCGKRLENLNITYCCLSYMKVIQLQSNMHIQINVVCFGLQFCLMIHQ